MSARRTRRKISEFSARRRALKETVFLKHPETGLDFGIFGSQKSTESNHTRQRNVDAYKISEFSARRRALKDDGFGTTLYVGSISEFSARRRALKVLLVGCSKIPPLLSEFSARRRALKGIHFQALFE